MEALDPRGPRRRCSVFPYTALKALWTIVLLVFMTTTLSFEIFLIAILFVV